MSKNISIIKNYKNSFFVVFGLIIFLVSKNYGMFWDNVLFASRMGGQLFTNSIFNWSIPDSFDPGHPPFLAFLLAIFWKIFGYKLWVSHLLMVPFVIGFSYQLYEFVDFFIKRNILSFFAFLLIIADPTLSTSFVLVNPEIIILFFFFLALNGLLKKNTILKFIGLFFLSIVSYRAMMLFAGIFIFDILNNLYIDKQKLKSFFNLKFLIFYFLASLPAFVFVGWRLATKGWLQTHPDSPWASLWQVASPKIFFKNCVVLVWRYIDFGRVFLFLFLTVSFIMFGKKIFKAKENKQLLLISICSVLLIVVISLFATNTFGHRYFIASYISFTLLSFLILYKFYQSKKIIYTLLFIGLFSGNLWIYPREISQGWDATLAHIPYHALRLEAIDYLDKNKIEIKNVASFFPNKTTIHYIDLNNDTRTFQHFNQKNNFVFYSNVYNLSDEDYKSLDTNYRIVKEFHKNNILIILYILKEK